MRAPAAPISGWWLLGPVLALLVAAVALVGATLWLAAGEINRSGIENSQRLADSALLSMRRSMELWVKDYAFWDETLKNIVVDPDPRWVAQNAGQYVFDTFGVSATIALRGDGGLAHVVSDARRPPLPDGFARAAVTALEPLISEARTSSAGQSVGVSGVAEVSGVAVLAAVAVITSARPAALASEPGPRPVLIFIRLLDDEAFREQADTFGLRGLRWVADAAEASPHACPVVDLQGRVVGFLDWRPELPGDTLMRRVAWPLAAIAVALAAIGGLVLRRVVRANQDLHLQAQALQRTNEQLSQHAARARSALQRAEHATRAKSSFLAGISHELRTPLTAIIGFSQILKLQHHPGKGRTREQEYAEIIHDSSQHLLNLVNDILDLSRIESGGYQLEESWIDVGREARVVQSLLAHEAERKGVGVVVEVQPGLPALYGDPKGLRQILINLLSNSLKFTHRGGRAQLALRTDDAGGLTVEVTDNGAGIAPEDQKDIWEAFKRARSPGLAKAEGSGLGLHLVKVLAELHGAEIGLQSALGEGTRVWVSFGADRVRSLG